MILWLVLKLEICYRVIISWRISVSFRGILKIIFLHGEIFEFPSFFFCLKILFNVNGKASVTHLVLLWCKHEAFVAPPPPPPRPPPKGKNMCKCELFWALCCKQKFPSQRCITKVVSQCLEFRCSVWELLNLNTFCYWKL
jgi:hypothetical protein